MQLTQAPISFEEKDKRAASPVVLVIDDKPAIREMLSWVLSLQGYQPVCITNGQEALEWIEGARHTQQYPDAILLDLLMPVMNGEKFLARLRAQWDAPVPIPPVILLTVDKGSHEDLACSTVLMKPFHINDLYERLKLCLRERR
ncbi:MAG: response regulator transcription factor [Chloroflexi bacterium]|nr:response regulator transcription factor [Chloroflexota bacterium]